MDDALSPFEKLVRSTKKPLFASTEAAPQDHPFEARNIHPALPKIVLNLFDDGHYAQATFEAFKFVDKEVVRVANSGDFGVKLMMSVFSQDAPVIKLTSCSSTTEKDEQKGFMFLFAGSMLAIRNPHDYSVPDTPDECLDHLTVASVLLRRLEAAGFKLKS